MAGRIPDNFIDELLTRIDIVDVIEQRVPLRKAGRDYSARCPFHDERSPSFTVSPAKQFFHCFGCGAHGSAIKFLMDYDRLEFVDAVEELATRAGLTVPYEGGNKRAPQTSSDSGDLYTLMDASAKFYQRELPRSEKACAYFASRGLDADTITRFGLGFAPDEWGALKSALGTTPPRLALLEKGGMLINGEKGSTYDRFRDRVMFPIHDRRGRVIAFGGRVLGDGTPKYLNSPETPLFHKGQQLFALWHVRQANAKIARLIVVEGYMDVIALFQHGITQAVATLGTATTREHAELLFRNSADVFFCFDGDRAGRSAAWRAVESVLPRMRDGRQAFFLFLPDGEDPDSLVRTEGTPGFEQRLANATPLSEFFFAHQESETNLGTTDGRSRLAEKCKALIESIPDGAFKDRMQEVLVEKTAISWPGLARTHHAVRDGAQALLEDRVLIAKGETPDGIYKPAPQRMEKSLRSGARAPERSLVRSAITTLVQQPACAMAIQPPTIFAALRQPGIPLLVELITLCRARPDISTGAVLEHFSERSEAAALRKLAVEEIPGDAEMTCAIFLETLGKLNRQTEHQRRDELQKKSTESSLSADEMHELRALLNNRNNNPAGAK
ncbi:DNA primase [Pseudolysobacter antarcticus]|uniref:DNA primase n=1 Tax=Pseudolysobacter antarcticus TaxID=2511995 RepID=A0A411HNW7_9GAMM|nr:DNA primase [Pseudolysobacter antarcticus]QBB72189.1 DNA primase [Pseudolysobacter antarcticus]